MAHKTLIGGTAYEIDGGKTLIGGTAYEIDKGKTIVGGTAYDIGFWTPPPLSECTPEEVQAVAQSGKAANYWAVGDTIGIALNGTFAGLSVNDTYYAFIIGFDHNSTLEGSKTIHFQFGKTSDGVDVCFYKYGYGGNGFCMNTTRTNSGGWASSYMRSTICPAFLSAMPTAWQNVIKACTKYTDNIGDGADTASNVTATEDKIWLLAEFEITGTRSMANSAEQTYQKRYDYYANGNSAVKYKHDSLTTAYDWWLRSLQGRSGNFCRVVGNLGSVHNTPAAYSLGFAPGFMVA